MSRGKPIAAYVLALALVVVAANWIAPRVRVYGIEPPEYGTWLGVIEVERKMRLLREFAAGGDVDALVFSSSMGDFGISAETLSREISAARGKPFRVFNFSMGGADLSSYPLLYRYARLVAKPKEVWIATPLSASHPVLQNGSLDDQLLRGPLGRYRDAPLLFRASWEISELPMVRYAAAIRDAAVHAKFVGRPVTSLDLYEVNSHGDMVSWLYNVKQYGDAASLRENRRRNNMKFLEAGSAELQKMHDAHFNPRTLEALNDLKSLAARDEAKITIIATDLAVALSMRDRAYLDSSAPFFSSLSRILGAEVIDIRPSFELQPYMLSDLVHLNALGSTEFSRLLAARLSGRDPPARPQYVVSERIERSLPDPRWTTFTALIAKRGEEPSGTLELHCLQNWGVTLVLPYSYAAVGVRLPDDSEYVVPARTLWHGVVQADTSRIPFSRADQIVTVQIFGVRGGYGTGINLPVISHRWLLAQPQPAEPFVPSVIPEVHPEKETFGAHERIHARWSGVDNPRARDWVGVYRAGEMGGRPVIAEWTGGGANGTVSIQPVLEPGRYELRFSRNSEWGLLATSEPFDVVADGAGARVR